jgi:hypothetical protein
LEEGELGLHKGSRLRLVQRERSDDDVVDDERRGDDELVSEALVLIPDRGRQIDARIRENRVGHNETALRHGLPYNAGSRRHPMAWSHHGILAGDRDGRHGAVRLEKADDDATGIEESLDGIGHALRSCRRTRSVRQRSGQPP